MNTALTLVFHPQLDFTALGALQYPLPEYFFERIADFLQNTSAPVAVLDAHEGNHCSFASQHLWRYPGQILQTDGKAIQLFPIHAVQGTFGASVVRSLQNIRWKKILQKNQHSDSCGFDEAWTNILQHLLQEYPPHSTIALCGIEHEGIIEHTKFWLIAQGFETVEPPSLIFYPTISVEFPPNL